ncbi:Lsr2 family protein [Rhodococcus sp. BP-349]|uniref:Lsr2 dimerization domain-containing protein n=1 Tax=unclassified Rhodococcus (in: high G+C Gram-positive bacteria) TaxID=192944 RepID=UPI001C9A41DE|nr:MULTISPECIES: histone-like nucleoid-structuring protein Lsr2 [unclassified Rhodococcus (in: high G+C Gram-positive bacteria)]MBY6537963.1 Lsr2 family protein [Rhodococcus sp. BP-363]MBY6542300.1 Lsr2 family protein [Rhodococcus sp. BP-369]MBY6561530.1 Lsr2 family protein [Rhodococcus sp. BP-370]MBY6575822.1 Lsr2 family protein [Rhodococcus sp. BP-364]MBY6585123.1 Lsr2 family protein [Rhodococcus sp. BP-358]
MVRKIDVTLIDDLDGMSADDTVVFGYRGMWFEIDLSAENAAQIHGLLTEWSNRGRRSEDISTVRRRTAADRAETAAIRT